MATRAVKAMHKKPLTLVATVLACLNSFTASAEEGAVVAAPGAIDLQSALGDSLETGPLLGSVGVANTEDEDGAVQAEVVYDLGIRGIFQPIYDPERARGAFLNLTPSALMKVGGDDTFSSVIGKLSGNFVQFATTEEAVPGVVMPDLDRMFHVFPIAVGLETTQNLDALNALVEVGYAPFYLRPLGINIGNSRLALGLNPRIGVFLQAGYKFDIDGNENEDNEEAAEGEEDPDDALLRTKASVSMAFELFSFGENENNDLSVIFDLTGWYDLANAEFYDREDVILRFGLAEGRFFDLKYQNGSGAPNFNEGDQFSANVTIAF